MDLQLSASDTSLSGSDTATVTVGSTTGVSGLALSPAAGGPVLAGMPYTLQATLKNASGTPVSGQTVNFVVTGTHSFSGSGVTDANGQVSYTYTGTLNGNDNVAASTTALGGLQSNPAVVGWVIPQQNVTLTKVVGRFFRSDGQGSFNTPPSQQPLFTQEFSAINFNPPPGTVPGMPATIDVSTRPFVNVTTDPAGNYTGSIIAQGNGFQAGMGKLYVSIT